MKMTEDSSMTSMGQFVVGCSAKVIYLLHNCIHYFSSSSQQKLKQLSWFQGNSLWRLEEGAQPISPLQAHDHVYWKQTYASTLRKKKNTLIITLPKLLYENYPSIIQLNSTLVPHIVTQITSMIYRKASIINRRLLIKIFGKSFGTQSIFHTCTLYFVVSTWTVNHKLIHKSITQGSTKRSGISAEIKPSMKEAEGSWLFPISRIEVWVWGKPLFWNPTMYKLG